MDAPDRAWRCLRRHRHRTLEGDPLEPARTGSDARTARRHLDDVVRRLRRELPLTVGDFDLVGRAPTAFVWRRENCTVRLWLARNHWHTTFATATGEPQIEEHTSWRRALAYAVGYMEQYAGVAVVADGRPPVSAEDEVLDEVELAIGQVQSAIDSIPDIDAVGDALIEDV